MTDTTTTIQDLKDLIERFSQDREWAQFHDIKNLSMALSVESSELMEYFLWARGDGIDEQMSKYRPKIEEELVDIFWILMCICNRYNVDLSAAFELKMKQNAEKYPIEKARGNSKKYSEF